MNALTQFYSIDLLDFGPKGVFEINSDTDAAIQMIPDGPRHALLIATNRRNALLGVQRIYEILPMDADLQRIEYTIVGSPDSHSVGAQRYKHDFKRSVRIVPDGPIGILGVQLNAGALFIPYQMNVLLDTDKFAKVTAIQFIA